MNNAVIRSVSDDQTYILKSILRLHCPSGIEVDLSYGNGVFYKDIEAPNRCYDIDPQLPHVVQACSTSTPEESSSVSSVMFDPPFLTYVRAGRDGNGSMIMAGRFSGYWTYGELTEHYKETIREASRILKKKGVLVFKCQDIVHNHRLHCTHNNVIEWAKEYGFRLKDLFVLVANHRLPAPNRVGTQKHARIHHSYFLVLEKL